jgi:hypothetical protein
MSVAVDSTHSAWIVEEELVEPSCQPRELALLGAWVSLVTTTAVELDVFPAASLSSATRDKVPWAKPVVLNVADQDPDVQTPPLKPGAADPLTLRATLRPFSEQVPDVE